MNNNSNDKLKHDKDKTQETYLIANNENEEFENDISKIKQQNRELRKDKNDLTQELNECHTHIQEMHQTQNELQTRYEELHTAKLLQDKLFQSLQSGNDFNQNIFAAEKLQWDEDKVQLLDEIRTKDNKIEELKAIQTKLEIQMKDLRAQTLMKQESENSTIKQETEQVNDGLDDDTKAKMIALLDAARKYKSQNEKLQEKVKAYKRRDEVNKQLRENWNGQLSQMEQAVLLSNEIYNRERTRHENEMAEKDVEILKLRKFLLQFTNKHAKQSKSSKVVKPKIVKAGGSVIKPRTFQHNATNKSRPNIEMERKSDD
eukprot:405956_1